MTTLAIDKAGIIEGYASVFGIADLARDVVMAGAFRNSLNRTGIRGVRCLWQHDPAEPIGVWLSLEEDTRGLFARGQLNLETQRGRELTALITQGAVDGLSIGFRARRTRRNPRNLNRELLVIDLWEISLVSFPLLPEARLLSRSTRTISPHAERTISQLSKSLSRQKQICEFQRRLP